MTHSFKLEWHELDDELKQQKFDDYIHYQDIEAGEDVSRREAEDMIAAYFPIYF